MLWPLRVTLYGTIARALNAEVRNIELLLRVRMRDVRASSSQKFQRLDYQSDD